jgi:hypothetical protein
LLWTFLKKQISNRRHKKPAYNIGIANSGAWHWSNQQQ